MKTQILATTLPALLLSGCAWMDFSDPTDEPVTGPVSSTEQASQEYLAGRVLDAIEGAWVHEGGDVEIVITRNEFGIAPEFDYLGIVTESDDSRWQKGDVKLLIREAEGGNGYEGIWLTKFKSPARMDFAVEGHGLIQGHYTARDGNAYFARVRRIGPGMPIDFAVLEETEQLMALLAEFRREPLPQ